MFVYLGDMLNDTGRVEQAVAARVRAVWMKFRELGGILCMRGASVRIKGVVYKACVCSVLMCKKRRGGGDKESVGVKNRRTEKERQASEMMD